MTTICETSKPLSVEAMPPQSLLKAGVTIGLRPRQRLALGREHEHVFVVRSGVVILECLPQPSARQILDLFYPGDVISGQLVPQIAAINLVAATQGEVVRLGRARLQSMLDTEPEVRRWMDSAIASQYPRRLAHLATIGTLTGEERAVTFLIELALRTGEPNADGARTFDMPLSRTDMADYLSLNADTLSRIMSRLRQAGVLGLAGRGRGHTPNFAAMFKLTPMADTVAELHGGRTASNTRN